MDLKKITKFQLAEELRQTNLLLADSEGQLLKVKAENKALKSQVDEKAAAKKALRVLAIATDTLLAVKFPNGVVTDPDGVVDADYYPEEYHILKYLNEIAGRGLGGITKRNMAIDCHKHF